MSTLNLLFLISGVGHEILSFLSLAGLTRLDAAMVRQEDREAFLSMYEAVQPLDFTKITMPLYPSILTWAIKRGVRMENMILEQLDVATLTLLADNVQLLVGRLCIHCYYEQVHFHEVFSRIPSKLKSIVCEMFVSSRCSDELLGQIGSNFTNMMRLHLNKVHSFDHDLLVAALNGSQALVGLTMEGQAELLEGFGVRVRSTLARLTMLRLHCVLNEASILGVLVHCRRLTHLHLSNDCFENNPSIMMRVLTLSPDSAGLQQCFRTIEHVSLYRIVLSPDSTAMLAEYTPRLQQLLAPAAQVGNLALHAWAANKPPLVVLEISWRVHSPFLCCRECAGLFGGLTEVSLQLDDGSVECIEHATKALAHMHRVKSLHLQGVSIARCLFLQLAQSCPLLCELEVHSRTLYSDTATWRALAKGHPLLTRLLLSCPISDEILLEVAPYCPLLVHVQLEAADVLTDAGLVALAEKCPHLQSLTVQHATALTDASLRAIALHSNRLTCLSLPDSVLLTENGVHQLMQQQPTEGKLGHRARRMCLPVALGALVRAWERAERNGWHVSHN